MRRSDRLFTAAFSISVMLGVQSVSAQVTDKGPVADFYRGKTINGYIGTVVGGEYDQHARLIFRFMGKYIPGNPTIVPQNMLGASGITGANMLFSVVPKDGSVIGMFAHTVPLDPLIGEGAARFDPSRFNWLGNMEESIGVCAVWHGTHQGCCAW